MPTAQEVRALDALNKVSYALTVPPIAFWLVIVLRLLVNKDMRKLS